MTNKEKYIKGLEDTLENYEKEVLFKRTELKKLLRSKNSNIRKEYGEYADKILELTEEISWLDIGINENIVNKIKTYIELEKG